MIVISGDNKLIEQDILLEILSVKNPIDKRDVPDLATLSQPNSETGLFKHSQKELIKMALTKTYGSRKRTAEILGMGTTTLWRKIKALNLEAFAEAAKKGTD